MANDGLYRNEMVMGPVHRAGLGQGLRELEYGIEKTHGDGRFEMKRISRDVVEGFSTWSALIETAMSARDERASLDNPKLADRAAPMARTRKRDVDKGELRGRGSVRRSNSAFRLRPYTRRYGMRSGSG